MSVPLKFRAAFREDAARAPRVSRLGFVVVVLDSTAQTQSRNASLAMLLVVIISSNDEYYSHSDH